MMHELIALAEQFRAPFASTLKMNHAGYELIRDEIPTVLPHGRPVAAWEGVRIVIDNDVPPEVIQVLDQYGKLLDVIEL